MSEIERIKELTSILNKARDDYYNNSSSEISDYDYDALYDELVALEDEKEFVMINSPTITVGYEVKSKLEKVKHSHPMLSLGKTKSTDDLISFAGDKDCLLMCKIDGLTVLLTYDNGFLIQAETRGNGEEGEIITHNAKVFKNIPLQIDFKGRLEIEGEAIITYKDFEIINSKLANEDKYKNPRNLVSGSVRQLDSKIAASRNIRFLAWKVPSGLYLTSFEERLRSVRILGFDIVPFVFFESGSNFEYIEDDVYNLKEISQDKSIPIDGLVMAYDNIEYGESLGNTGHHPRHSIAFKFYDEESVSTIKEVKFSMGKIGTLTPVAIFDPVDIDGTEVERASLHNISILKDLQIGIGDEITVYKANAIIPQIRDNLTRSNNLIIPTKCPVCGGSTAIVKENETEVLVCNNNLCKGKLLGKLSHFVSKNAMNIDGLSEATLDKFIELGYMKSYEDIYDLKDHADSISRLEGFGKKSVVKLLAAIEDSKDTTLDRFIYSLSIPLIGRTASKDIAKSCNNDLDSMRMIIDLEADSAFMNIDGFGKEMNRSLVSWWKENKDMVFTLSELFTFKKDTAKKNDSQKDLTGITFVITGSLNTYENRDACKAELESLGAKVSGSVSAKTSYLINNDNESVSGKNKKAKELGIPIITEEELLKMIR